MKLSVITAKMPAFENKTFLIRINLDNLARPRGEQSSNHHIFYFAFAVLPHLDAAASEQELETVIC